MRPRVFLAFVVGPMCLLVSFLIPYTRFSLVTSGRLSHSATQAAATLLTAGIALTVVVTLPIVYGIVKVIRQPREKGQSLVGIRINIERRREPR